MKTGQNQVIINVTAVNGITTKKYYINAYKRNEEEEKTYNEEQQNKINEANEIIEKMNSDEILQNEEDILEHESEENSNEENREAVDKVFMIVGIILAVLVIGVVVIRVRKS